MNHSDAPDPRKVAEAALEAFVYVPVGLALEAKDLLPKLAQRGKNQVVLARLGARFAVKRAEAEAEKLIGRWQHAPEPAPARPAAAAPAPASPTSASPAPASATPASDPVRTSRPAASLAATPAARSGPAPRATAPPTRRRTAAATTAPAPRAGRAPTLAIPGYDTLSASQVVPRLDALRPAELDAIRRHEEAHRGRRTILSRIAQLQA